MFVSQILKPDDILPTAKNCFKVPPYDLYCPSVESCLTDRVCKVCNMYFASQVMLKKHLGVHAAIRADAVETMAAAAAPQRIRPLRVAARRQRELMVLIAQRELNSEYAEWVDENLVDLTDIELPVATGDLAMPTVSVVWQAELTFNQ